MSIGEQAFITDMSEWRCQCAFANACRLLLFHLRSRVEVKRKGGEEHSTTGQRSTKKKILVGRRDEVNRWQQFTLFAFFRICYPRRHRQNPVPLSKLCRM